MTSPHGPIQLRNGNILWVGRGYDPEDCYFKEQIPFVRAALMDADGNFCEIGRIEDCTDGGEEFCSCEPHVVELPDGKLICHIRAQNTGRVYFTTPNPDRVFFTTYQSESTDGGYHWTRPHRILAQKGGAPSHLYQHSSGVLIMTYGYRNRPYGIRAQFSLDGGETWQDEVALAEPDVSTDVGYPSTVELMDGSLLTVYYSKPDTESPSVIWGQKWKIDQK